LKSFKASFCVFMNEKRLKIAIQRSGRLSASSIDLLKKCDINFNDGLGKLRSIAENFPLEIFSLRDDDIPQYVEDGVADVGIIGENIVAENGCDIKSVAKLGFGKCRLSLAVPKAFRFSATADLAGCRIATTYPEILKNYLIARSVKADIHNISGSVEIAPSIGVADAVCDLVGSGSTLFSNGLVEVETVMTSEAVLVSHRNLEPDLQNILDKLLFRISAVRSAQQNKYILLNAPNEKLDTITRLLPGIKSPTIMPLAEAGWSSLHSVINENDFWEIVEKLRDAGAEGILILSIDQMIGGQAVTGA
jgi:ATP phosphoribosyltransferase